MHKNIRRSIAVAATATGMWALGTAAASADELPVSVPLSTPDHAADATDVINGVDGAEGLEDTVRTTAGEARTAVGDTVSKATEAAGRAGQVTGLNGKATGATGTVGSAVDRAVGGADVQGVPDLQGVQDLSGAYGTQDLQGLPGYDVPWFDVSSYGVPTYDAVPTAPDAPIDYLFGPIEQIPGYAQNTVPGAVATARSTARGALAQAGPLVGQTFDSVLPPVVVDAVSAVLPVVGQALEDGGTLVRGVVSEVSPFAHGVVEQDALPFVHGVTPEVAPLADGVAGAVQPFAGGAVAEVQPLAQGLTGNAVTPFAQGVTALVKPLAQGVGAQAQPFAAGLVGTAGGDARPAVEHAAYGAAGPDSTAPAYLSDAEAAFTAPEYSAQGI
ncbi:hypothetical protein [Streptomyces atratus]|uniref:hypothetical protein n=1 Tax=Streptomyces atratus TaxID=1893 RepID=UPI0033F9317C